MTKNNTFCHYDSRHPVGVVALIRLADVTFTRHRLNRLRFFWTRIWGKTCVWKRS
ncbi:MAG: hypothetical protein VB143_08675 [Burkholderia sp.]